MPEIKIKDMELRDLFAAHIAAAETGRIGAVYEDTQRDIVRRAYKIADLMIEERER